MVRVLELHKYWIPKFRSFYIESKEMMQTQPSFSISPKKELGEYVLDQVRAQAIKQINVIAEEWPEWNENDMQIVVA